MVHHGVKKANCCCGVGVIGEKGVLDGLTSKLETCQVNNAVDAMFREDGVKMGAIFNGALNKNSVTWDEAFLSRREVVDDDDLKA